MRFRWVLRLFLLTCCAYGSPPPETRGRVLDAISGRGIPGVLVTGNRLRTTTDSNGDFQLATIQPYVTFERDGYKSLSEHDLAGVDGNSAGSWSEPGAPASTLRLFEMIPLEYLAKLTDTGAFLFGTVVDETNRPIAGAVITVVQDLPVEELGGPPSSTRTDADGRFSLKVHSGDARVAATDSRCCDKYGLQIQKRGPLTASLHLESGQRKELTLVLKPPHKYTVTGSVRNHVPPYGGFINIWLEPDPLFFGPSVQWFSTGGNESMSSFSMRDVPSGRYLVRSTLQKYVPDCDTCSNEPSYESRQYIDVPSKDGRAVAVDFFPGTEITGVIRWASAPSAYFNSSICLANPIGGGYCSFDRTLIRMFRVQPGEYDLVAGFRLDGPRQYSATRDGSAYLTDAHWNGAPFRDYKIVVPPDAKQATLDLTFSATFARCAPRIVDRDHKPLTLYSVILMQRHGDHYIVAAVDPRTPEYHAYLPGKYLLFALTPALPAPAFRAGLLAQYADRAVPVTLTPGETLRMELTAIEDHPLAQWLDHSNGVR